MLSEIVKKQIINSERIIFTDLDDTYIASERTIQRTGDKIVLTNGRAAVSKKLKLLHQWFDFDGYRLNTLPPIAVTARDISEMKQAFSLPIQLANVALVNFGALMIQNDLIDDTWKSVQEYESYQKSELIKQGNKSRHHYYLNLMDTVKTFIVDNKLDLSVKTKTEMLGDKEYPCYIKIMGEQQQVEQFKILAQNTPYTTFIKTRKGCVLLNDVDTKEFGVAFLMEYFRKIKPELIMVAAGNAKADKPFMDLADIAVQVNLFFPELRGNKNVVS